MIKICKNCGKEFECFDKPNKSRSSGGRHKIKRPFNALTCSMKCSKEYDRKRIFRK